MPPCCDVHRTHVVDVDASENRAMVGAQKGTGCAKVHSKQRASATRQAGIECRQEVQCVRSKLLVPLLAR